MGLGITQGTNQNRQLDYREHQKFRPRKRLHRVATPLGHRTHLSLAHPEQAPRQRLRTIHSLGNSMAIYGTVQLLTRRIAIAWYNNEQL